jgi:hypothetical protein
MKELQVGAFIMRVKNAQPAILKMLIDRNFSGRNVFDAKIKVNAIPTAPLNPPYVKAPIYIHFKP